MEHNAIAQFIRCERKAAGMTQEEFAVRSGLGLRFSVNWKPEKRRCAWTK